MTFTQVLIRPLVLRLVCFTVFSAASCVYALTPAEVKGIASGEGDARIEALNKALINADDKTAAFLQALSEDAVKVAGEQVIVVKDDKGFDPITGAEIAIPDTAEDVMNNNRMRGELDTALATLKLFSKDEKVRGGSIKTLLSETDEAKLPLIEKAFEAETNPEFKDQLQLVRAAILLNSEDKTKRLEAAKLLSQSNNRNTKTVLLERLKTETEPDVKSAL
ncbi:MAG TPA: urea ABC transporter permease subunit UrtB, partial [Burkholderiaceae bacterium]|nr:urea ABC transporter permease subunit UrtB [Burkholderiaceae bacterium]